MERKWEPLAGPQTQALECKADILFYGGAAGGGKTDLILGAAHTQHQNSIIFRREFPQLKGIIDRSMVILGGIGKLNKVDKFWLLPGRQIEFGAVQHAGDEEKYQGRAHDLKAFDEITHFLESQFRYLIGWTRSADPKQRCRVICTGNPPTDPEGEWIITFWGPWLNPDHPNPAAPGELRWFATIAGKDIEVADGRPFVLIDDKITYDFDRHKFRPVEIIEPMSRTFIPAHVTDNPYYMASGYMRTLQSMPEPLRSKMLLGNFSVGREDNPWQIIPTEWIKLAQERWISRSKPSTPISALGVDVARGGKDKTILTPRYDNYFDEQHIHPGMNTPDGPAVAALVLPMVLGTKAMVNIDVIGVGGSVYDCVKSSHAHVSALNGAEGTEARDKTGNLGFVNQRAEWYWKLREALDPTSGQDIALPPDRELMVDLCTPRWKLTARGIQVEAKEDIIKRIGHSPDKGDSVVYAHAIKHVSGAGILKWYEQEYEKKQQQKQ